MQVMELPQSLLQQPCVTVGCYWCRFADLDPFSRSKFFGWSLDLGQFTRFQRVFHIRPFSLLLRHTRAERLSSLQVGHMCESQASAPVCESSASTA